MLRQELSLADKRQRCRFWDEYEGPGLGVGRSLSKQTQQIKGLNVRHVCEYNVFTCCGEVSFAQPSSGVKDKKPNCQVEEK